MLLSLPEPKDFTAATLQFRPVPGNPLANTEKMLELIDKACNKAAVEGIQLNLVILPELSTTGIIFDRQEAEKCSEEISGPIISSFIQKAKEKNIFIVLGMAERQAGKFFNTAVLIDPDGVRGTYRKVHLSSFDKKMGRCRRE
ncbi:MAG: hypothetical protein PWP31_239 [Clostridia bacterium]|nr:hypothetical protein [Clostridia bacterium]